MDDEKNDVDKGVVEDVMLPGFRFHPTDEELVGFYLKKKIQQRTLPIELIKQVDIYKYDPWDLPRLASTGEKEMYFYCPRDRKYRNSTRPNRVTGAGFWKATGTDRPIYSSDGSKCIGLKKSLVFYRGRAAKGIKTDWMMHEFRLPSLSDSMPPKKFLDRSFPANDSWAICRIFKKASSMAQKALSHSWFSLSPENTSTDHMFNQQGLHSTQFSSGNISCTSETGSAAVQLLCCNDNNGLQQASTTSFSAMEIPHRDFPTNFMFTPFENLITDVSKTSDNIDFGGPQIQFNDYSIGLPEGIQGNMATQEHHHAGLSRAIGFPFNLPSSTVVDPWKANPMWDSPPCPSSEMSTSYSTNKC